MLPSADSNDDKRSRIAPLDIARGVALVAMAIYHFTWDLEFFGYLPTATIVEPGWKYFARAIASSFLLLVGISLVLAHGHRFGAKPFLRRLIKVAVAAALVSLATWLIMPGGFVFFGILHIIALGSVLALPLLRLPWQASVLAAGFFIIGARIFSSPYFDAPVWYWTGLSSKLPHSNDYEPVFPWFSAIALGVAIALVAKKYRLFDRLTELSPSGQLSSALAFLGRHSLLTYLVHQPVLFGSLYVFVALTGGPDRTPAFIGDCESNCTKSSDAKFCQRFCACAVSEFKAQDLWLGIHQRNIDIGTDPRVASITNACTTSSEQ